MSLRPVVIALLLSLGACGHQKKHDAPDLQPAADLSPPPPDLLVPPSGIGKACASDTDCATGQLCLTEADGLRGGYCSLDCNSVACPSDATCFQQGAGSRFCLRSCKVDADCRTSEGYTCTNDTCFPPLMPDGVPPGTNDGGACVTPIVAPSPAGGLFGTAQNVTSGVQFASECQLAVDGTSKRVVIAYNDLSGNGIGFTRSGDDGLMFQAPLVLPANTLVDMNNSQSDPVVAVDAAGTFFISFLGYDLDANGNTSKMQLWVARSNDGGVTFADIFPALPAAEGKNGGLDKPWIAVNPVDQSLMVTWFLAGASNTEIRMSRSVDHGQTWSTPVTLSDSTRPQADRNLAQLAFGADGMAVVAWVELVSEQFGAADNQIYLQRIKADGTLDGANVLVSRPPDSPAFDDPSVAVFGTNVYVGFVSGTPKGDWDVRIATSLDGGATFATSVQVNDDSTCATHFNQQIQTDAAGNVHALWIDNRYLVGNVFHAVSAPATSMAPLGFGAGTFVNSASFGFTTDRASSQWLGDYLGMSIVGGEIYAAWSAPPSASQDTQIYFSRGLLPK